MALPPGEWEFGYSIDACWAPPINVPVTDISKDFPKNANTMLDYRIDASISGPLVGEETSLLKMKIYKHFPDLLEHTSSAMCYANCVDYLYDSVDPALVTTEYYEYHFELNNQWGRPPGSYPVVLRSGVGSIEDVNYFYKIDPYYGENASFYQVFWVEVASD